MRVTSVMSVMRLKDIKRKRANNKSPKKPVLAQFSIEYTSSSMIDFRHGVRLNYIHGRQFNMVNLPHQSSFSQLATGIQCTINVDERNTSNQTNETKKITPCHARKKYIGQRSFAALHNIHSSWNSGEEKIFLFFLSQLFVQIAQCSVIVPKTKARAFYSWHLIQFRYFAEQFVSMCF